MKRPLDFTLLLSALFVLGLKVEHFALHPEWTEAQAFMNRWEFYLGAILVACMSVYFRDKNKI